MKNKLLLLLITIAFCLAIQLNMSNAGEKQGWYDWARSKWTTLMSSRKLEKSKYILPATVLGSSIASQTLTTAIPSFPMPSLETERYADLLSRSNFQIILTTGLLFGALAWTIYTIDTYYKTGAWSRTEAISQIKNSLRSTLSDPLLYPTRSSKLDTLRTKNEFAQYITDEYGFVQEACAELDREISDIPYSENQKKIDEAIDAKIAEVKETIINYETLDKQIKILENPSEQLKQTLDIPGMQAYLSVYFRLKNKQNASKQFLQKKL